MPLVISALLLSCLSGCGSSEHTNGGDDDHLEHFVPAHKPANFSRAVEEIRHRAEHLTAHAVHGHDDEPAEFQELLDIVNWLPELTADSDLNEADWNTASTAAQSIAEKLGKRRTADGSLSLQELPSAIVTEMQTLQALVSAAGKPEPAMHHGHDHNEHDHHHHEHEPKTP